MNRAAAQGQIDRLERQKKATIHRRRFEGRNGRKSGHQWNAYFREVDRLNVRLAAAKKRLPPLSLAELIRCPKFQKQMLGRLLREPSILSLPRTPRRVTVYSFMADKHVPRPAPSMEYKRGFLTVDDVLTAPLTPAEQEAMDKVSREFERRTMEDMERRLLESCTAGSTSGVASRAAPGHLAFRWIPTMDPRTRPGHL